MPRPNAERGEEARPPPPSPSAEWLAGAGKGSTSPLINPAILLDAHNRYRVLSGVANLTWDSALSRQAQAWADKCVAGHSGTPGTGENIAWGVYMEPEETLSGVISWANEICNYDWKNPGFTAGHYTQIVWKSTRRVGCGYKLCNPSPGGGSRNGWLVCQYQPPGNMQGTQNYRDNVIQPKVLPTTCDAVGPGWGTVGRSAGGEDSAASVASAAAAAAAARWLGHTLPDVAPGLPAWPQSSVGATPQQNVVRFGVAVQQRQAEAVQDPPPPMNTTLP
eukprot:XP_001698090.1 predicted extracellular protein [Chlamydomonas reinhardtii]